MTLQSYRDLIAGKRPAPILRGFDGIDEAGFPDRFFDHQRHGVAFALRTGAAGLFYDTGLGKTGMELVWGGEVARRTNGRVLMLAPLAVGKQHLREAGEWGVDAAISRDGKPAKADVTIANYERLHLFDPDDFSGIILDESSILKNFSGAMSRRVRTAFAGTPYRLSASATPAPNDHTELGQQSEFLGVMNSAEMLSRWFIADQAQKRYRLKKPAVRPYWDWVASWARCVSKPSDLGFSDDGFELPALDLVRHLVDSDVTVETGGDRDGQAFLFRLPDTSATSIHREKRMSAEARAERAAALAFADPDDFTVIWIDTDYEADALRAACPGIVEVSGSMRLEEKEERLEAFSAGQFAKLATKPSIAGYGLNWQHCAHTVFMGLSFSYESFYQAIRRFLRYGQRRTVRADVVGARAEEAIWRVVSRKQGDHDSMKTEMAAAMARAARAATVLHSYAPQQEARLPAWMIQ